MDIYFGTLWGNREVPDLRVFGFSSSVPFHFPTMLEQKQNTMGNDDKQAKMLASIKGINEMLAQADKMLDTYEQALRCYYPDDVAESYCTEFASLMAKALDSVKERVWEIVQS